MVKTILLIANSVLVVWLSTSWAAIFRHQLRYGEACMTEPSLGILTTEFALAILVAIFGIATLCYCVIKGKES